MQTAQSYRRERRWWGGSFWKTSFIHSLTLCIKQSPRKNFLGTALSKYSLHETDNHFIIGHLHCQLWLS